VNHVLLKAADPRVDQSNTALDVSDKPAKVLLKICDHVVAADAPGLRYAVVQNLVL
jgi:hypothetical protein